MWQIFFLAFSFLLLYPTFAFRLFAPSSRFGTTRITLPAYVIEYISFPINIIIIRKQEQKIKQNSNLTPKKKREYNSFKGGKLFSQTACLNEKFSTKRIRVICHQSAPREYRDTSRPLSQKSPSLQPLRRCIQYFLTM